MDTVDRASSRVEPLEAAAEAVAAAAKAAGREADVEASAGFARAVLRRVPVEALRRAAPDEVASAILARFVFVADRAPGEIALRVLERSEPAVDGTSPRGTLIDLACDDRDFIVTSLTEELHRLGHRPTRLVRASFGRLRDPEGHLVEVGPARGADEGEAFLEIELEGHLPAREAASVVAALRRVLDDVVSATSDYPAMRRLVEQAADRTRANGRQRFDPEEVAETAALVEWMLSGHLVLLGTCVFPVRGEHIRPADDERSLGVLRDPDAPLRQPPARLPDRLLDVSRSPEISTVHRQVPLQRLDLVLFDQHGRPEAVGRLVAVFSNRAEASQVTTIPLLRWKLRRILELEDCVVGSYDEQAVVSLFQAIPKDELFHDDVATLHATIALLLAESRDGGVRVLLHVDEPSRTVSVLVTLPSEAWTRSLRQRLERFVTTQLDGSRVDTDISLGGGTDAVARMIVHVRPDASMPTDSLEGVAREVRQLCRTWEQRLHEALRELVGDQAERLVSRWSDRFESGYRDSVDPWVAADDIADLDLLEGRDRAGIRLRLRLDGNRDLGPGEPGGDPGLFHLRITSVGGGIELSKLLPVLECVGLWVVDEQHWSVAPGDRHIHDLGVRVAGDARSDMLADPSRLVDAVQALWDGRAEVDSLNRLVLEAGISWQQVGLLRAYRRYRRQVDTRYTNEYVNDVLVAHPAVARGLLDVFASRFDPSARADAEPTGSLADRCRALCDKVERLDHDRILRGLLGTIEATLRTNHYVNHEGPFAIKIDSAAVPDAPAPRPYREIFVHGPTVEGLHLRAGPVARGGLRWSDRPEDYRSEVLDLMRTQVLKNAVIVPTGAKGGFVTKGDDGGDPRAHARAAYEAFIAGLLDVTDDIRGDEVIPVAGRRDGDDPYLVVAADKGTASFSDVANELAVRRGFWLGDAFASGGSQGYDHKALGITARGAWVAVQRHFRDLGIDVQTEPFTVVGVGDMSGDVFGNGMLRSEQTRLVAAFDHRDVFLDPDPDPAAGFAERQRLFSTPRSSWQDYDPAAISEGGGVFSRSAKSIALSRQARTALRLDVEDVTPAELIQAVLRAPVDLLYLGGIGTYVRAGTEDDRRLDDRANADLRVTAGSLRARVVGEGANLGFTQPARIEYARRGGRINMDAIDNAAGVDSSDHEVNLKILLSLAVDAGEITAEERNVLLGEHVDDVVAAVLSDTANQCDCLSHAVQPSADDLATFVGVLDELVEIGVVDPEVESLPDASELAARQRADAGLTRPELAVLLAGVKRKLRAEVLLSDLPDDAATRDALVGYFPPALAKRFDHLLDRHRLRRELVTSEIANDLVDRMGLTFVHRLGAEAGVGSADVARAYWYASRVVDAPALWARIDENTGTATATFDTDQVDGKQVLADLIESLARHELLIRHAPATLTERIAHERPVFLTLRQDLPRLDRPAQLRARSRLREQLMAGGLSSQVADEVATLTELDLVPDAALLARSTGRPAAEVAAAMLRISDRLGFDRVRDRVRTLPSVDGWSRSARQGLLDDLDELRRQAAKRALERHPESTGEEAADRFLDERSHRLHELGGMLRRLESDREAGLDALTVVVRAVRHAAT